MRLASHIFRRRTKDRGRRRARQPYRCSFVDPPRALVLGRRSPRRRGALPPRTRATHLTASPSTGSFIHRVGVGQAETIAGLSVFDPSNPKRYGTLDFAIPTTHGAVEKERVPNEKRARSDSSRGPAGHPRVHPIDMSTCLGSRWAHPFMSVKVGPRTGRSGRGRLALSPEAPERPAGLDRACRSTPGPPPG